jgi:hypothetical protein
VRYSNDGQKFLVITGTTQARLYNRDGEEEYVLAKLSELRALTMPTGPPSLREILIYVTCDILRM